MNKIGVKAAISLTGHSSKTIVNYFKDFRKTVGKDLTEFDNIIGGDEIEGNWNGLKHFLKPRDRTINVHQHLEAYIWRRLHKENLWHNFLNSLA